MTNYRARFMANNFAAAATLTYSSQLSSTYAFANTQNPSRSLLGKFSGNFTITTSNQKIYINDGSNKTANLFAGSYTYLDLPTAVAAALNAVSSGWSCTYDLSGGTFKFTIAHSGSATLRLTQTTNAAWDMLGYTGTTDRVGTSFAADEQRNHTDEWLKWDLTLAQEVTFFAAISNIKRVFGLSASASVHVQANNVDLWTAPPLDVTVTPHDDGLYRFFDDVADTTYRYWRFRFVDRLNTCGPEGFAIGHVYLGDHITFTTDNIQRGFQKGKVDPSQIVETESGARFALKRPKFRTFTNLQVAQPLAAERRDMEDLFDQVGQTTPFYASLDPTLFYSEELQELTGYFYFGSDARFGHVIRDYFDCSFELREAI